MTSLNIVVDDHNNFDKNCLLNILFLINSKCKSERKI